MEESVQNMKAIQKAKCITLFEQNIIFDISALRGASKDRYSSFTIKANINEGCTLKRTTSAKKQLYEAVLLKIWWHLVDLYGRT